MKQTPMRMPYATRLFLDLGFTRPLLTPANSYLSSFPFTNATRGEAA
jgi:hypothetical protein